MYSGISVLHDKKDIAKAYVGEVKALYDSLPTENGKVSFRALSSKTKVVNHIVFACIIHLGLQEQVVYDRAIHIPNHVPETLAAVRKFHSQTGVSPTVREVAIAIKRSTSTIHQDLIFLKLIGLVEYWSGMGRSIGPVEEPPVDLEELICSVNTLAEK